MKAASYNRIVDALMILRDAAAGAVGIDGGGTVGGAARIVDLNGSSASLAPTAGMEDAMLLQGEAVVDVTAIGSGGDHTYRVCIQVSSSPTFASDVCNAAILELSTQTPIGGGIAGAVGRYNVPFTNVWNKVPRRYCRVYQDVGGSGGVNITYTAHISKLAPYTA